METIKQHLRLLQTVNYSHRPNNKLSEKMHTRDIKPIGVNTKNSQNSQNSYQSIDPQSLDGTDLKAPKKPKRNHSGIIFEDVFKGSNKIKDSS
jgi:hypothetical protein